MSKRGRKAQPHDVALEQALATRFWPNVDRRAEYECWLWTGSLGPQRKPGAGRYGVLVVQGRQYRAHRLSWMIANGPIPDGMVIRHRCDVTGCVNPKHLELGTQDDNIADMIGRKRHTIGERNRHAKFTAEQVMAIRAMDEPDAVIAKRLGVWATTIRDIRIGKKWKHLPGARPEFYAARRRSPRYKLTAEQRVEIVRRRRAGEQPQSLASEFGIASGYVYALASRFDLLKTGDADGN